MHRVGSVEEELEVGSQGRRVRRNRRRVAGEVDRDLELLGEPAHAVTGYLFSFGLTCEHLPGLCVHFKAACWR